MTKIRDMEQVLDVAARLFGERGFEETRLEDIADELGVLKGSLYYYIDSKRQLLIEVNKRRLVALADRAAEVAASEGSPLAKLEAILRVHIHSIDEFYPESSQWFAGASTHRGERVVEGEPRHLHRQYADTITGLIVEGQAAGFVRTDLDARLSAMGILGACNWLTFWYRRGGPHDIEEVTDTILALVLDGLRSREDALEAR